MNLLNKSRDKFIIEIKQNDFLLMAALFSHYVRRSAPEKLKEKTFEREIARSFDDVLTESDLIGE